MKNLKSLLFVAALCFSGSAFAQLNTQTWNPTTTFIGFDGGNNPNYAVPYLSPGGAFAPITGHNVQISAKPALGTFNAGFGTATAITPTGTDSSMLLTFTTGTGGAIAAQAPLFVVTLAIPYSSTSYTMNCAYAQAAGTPGVSSFYGVATTAGTFTVYNTVGFTPATTTTYNFQCTTAGAAATY